MLTYESNIVLILLYYFPSVESGNRLNEYISHYETLSYDTQQVHEKHSRAKRSVTHDDSVVHLSFSAHSKQFDIRLKRDLSTFSDNLVVLDSHGAVLNSSQTDTSHIYSGHLVGEPESVVFGSLLDGVFEGKIISPSTGAYYVEKASRYFPPRSQSSISNADNAASVTSSTDTNTTNDLDFHSIVYKESDVEDPRHQHDSDHPAGCGITEQVKQWMESIQTSAVEEEEEREIADVKRQQQSDTNSKSPPPIRAPKKKRKKTGIGETPYQKYTKEWNSAGRPSARFKRATRAKEKDKNTCSLFIQTDPLIWRHISEQVGRDAEKTREEILSLIAHHVTAVNYIYRDTKFDGRVEHRNIKFEVQRIKMDEYSVCEKHHRTETNPFCMENIDVSNFLNLHSLSNHEDFCLAYVFTYRDFTGGTLGLAWVASASGASGGICEKYKTYTETVAGLYQSAKRSLNTGIITFVNYNTRVPPKVSQLTLAHEIGHNFGSPHDYPLSCRPGGSIGNYIMFASATSGDRPNNSKFSSCSIGNISSVLDAIEENKKRNCFKASEGAFCGNKIVEEGEECDCGFNENECSDECCYPRVVSDADKNANITARGCARRKNTECSPSQGPCCAAHSCKFVPADREIACKSESDCSRSSKCNGSSAECPLPPAKPDKTRCNEGTQLCIDGECRGSICLEWGLNECFLSSSSVPPVDKRKLCELACMNGTNECRSSSEFASIVGLPPGGISLRPGSPCDNFQGYCDVFFKCRAVDAEGPLARLKNMLLHKRTLLQQWAFDNWWACVLIAVIFIFVLGIFIKCCAVHTPSSNPKKPPARRFSETLRRPITTLRRMRGAAPAVHRGHSGERGHRSHHHGQHGSGYSQNHNRNVGNYRNAPPPSYTPSQHHHATKPSAPHATRADVYAHPHRDRNSFHMRQQKV
ncbi:disintegrin and metalloproteinase domain-containing protein 10-like [Planococcus citri]|uniref:disintegrin and metalloproteinase domain-containing protein 10-like n=1 Tax=Planococcus citri TaxID=170843 RepID=UPI0031F902CB